MNTALLPVPRIQFSDANGVPLAGGFVYSYAAGTTTPLATYQDANRAAANTNPVVLDASGSASIWLSSSAYKIVLEDVNSVVQWTQDNVSAVSQAELQGVTSFSSLGITGALTVGGNAEVDGTLTAASLAVTGTAAIAGALTAASAAITSNASVGGALSVTGALAAAGNETVGGTLTVTGATALSTLSVGGTDIAALITSLIPALTALTGTLVISNVAQAGNWLLLTFGATSGTRVRLAFGAGSGVANGGSITLPSGFSTSQLIAHASIDGMSTGGSGNNITQWAVSVTAGVITVTAGDFSGHTYAPTAAWSAVAWVTGY